MEYKKRSYILPIDSDEITIRPSNGRQFTHEELAGHLKAEDFLPVLLMDGRAVVAAVVSPTTDLANTRATILAYAAETEGNVIHGDVVICPASALPLGL